jgi:glutamate N-acetyltransferase/amino-acid N-acetyltransferase
VSTTSIRRAGAGIEPVQGGDLLSVPGINGAVAACGLYGTDRDDLALIVADAPRTAAAVFTTNRVAAAPVRLSRERIRARPSVRSVVINAGNANALTGPAGEAAALAMADRTEAACGGPSFVMSTGVIGVPLPVDDVLSGIDRAAKRVSGEAGPSIARAVLTTDTTAKTCAVRVAMGEGPRTVTVGGVAKGSGMIHPNMATMLAVVATEQPVDARSLQRLLRRVVDRSFHEISVDGETSTNDTVLLLAGPADHPSPLREGDERFDRLEDAVLHVSRDLAAKIVADGEGARKTLQIEVTGAASEVEARMVAESIARSVLVKTALAGGDPNWGRILSAAGNAGVAIDPSRIELKLGDEIVFRNGEPVDIRAELTERLFAPEFVRARLDLRQGDHRATMLTTDLTKEYVQINSEYTT